MASRSMKAWARLLMSSEVHAKWVNSITCRQPLVAACSSGGQPTLGPAMGTCEMLLHLICRQHWLCVADMLGESGPKPIRNMSGGDHSRLTSILGAEVAVVMTPSGICTEARADKCLCIYMYPCHGSVAFSRHP